MKKAMFMFFLMGLYSVFSFALTPVRIGGEDGLDACGSVAEVNTLRGAALKNAPRLSAQTVLHLPFKARVLVCSQHGKWLGVVVSPSEETDCQVSSPKKPQPYQGPCRSGWMDTSTLEIIAG